MAWVDAKNELNQPKIQVSPLMRLFVTSVYFVLCTLIVQCTLLNLSTNQRVIRDHAQPNILHHTDHARAQVTPYQYKLSYFVYVRRRAQ